tara:strand:- start:220 stop:951 length:732 start_codon:yes stop_codon:yes gene_type:complete
MRKLLSKIPQLGWDLDTLKTEPLDGDEFYALPAKLKQANFSIVLLRYWFVYHFLLAENANCKYLKIAEFPEHEGRLQGFINARVRKGFPEVSFLEWKLLASNDNFTRGPSERINTDKEKQNHDTGELKSYDVIIVSSLTKNASRFEQQIKVLLKILKQNAILIGVSSGPRSKQKKSSFTGIKVSQLRKIARQNGLAVDFLSGGYFMRSSGLIPVRHSLWFRLNLLLGALLPCWAAEIYWVLRK